MRINKRERQKLLTATIKENPFITDEELADKFSVSVQTIRLDRLELSIPELRERIKNVAEKRFGDEVRSLPLEEIIGEIIDINLDQNAISIFDVKHEHVFKRNMIARGHHLFASRLIFFTNPDKTLPGPISMNVSTPSSSILVTESSHKTGE